MYSFKETALHGSHRDVEDLDRMQDEEIKPRSQKGRMTSGRKESNACIGLRDSRCVSNRLVGKPRNVVCDITRHHAIALLKVFKHNRDLCIIPRHTYAHMNIHARVRTYTRTCTHAYIYMHAYTILLKSISPTKG